MRNIKLSISEWRLDSRVNLTDIADIKFDIGEWRQKKSFMKKNQKKTMVPFNMAEPPARVKLPMNLLMWSLSFVMTRRQHLKIKRKGMKRANPPYLVLSTHQGFSDYYIAPLALFPHRANYISDMEGFAAFGKGLYRSIGCIGKRRYVPDITVMKNVICCMERGDSVVIFPESRHSNIGITEKLPDNLGKLAKFLAKKCGASLVVLSAHGSYLANPFWDEEHTRYGRQEAKLELLWTAEELLKTDTDEIQNKIKKKLTYDEYRWQKENKIRFKGKDLAKGLELPLYACNHCGTLFEMKSHGNILSCEKCKTKWTLDEYGRLKNSEGKEVSMTKWYRWERKKVEEMIRSGEQFEEKYHVRIEALPNEFGFVSLGEGTMTVDNVNIILKFTLREEFDYVPKKWRIEEGDRDKMDERKKGNGKTHDKHSEISKQVTLTFPIHPLESLQTEYNYRRKGKAVVLSHRDASYYVYSDDKHFNPTRLQLIVEAL